MSKLFAIVGALCVMFTSGCAFIPTPVRLTDRPASAVALPAKDVKVCVIVTDERPGYIQKCNMCGVMRNGYMMKTSFAFLAHAEHLDAILSHHLKKYAERDGLTVIKSYPPAPDTLSSRAIKAKELDKDAKKAAWKDRGKLVDKDATKEAKKEKKNKATDAVIDPADGVVMGPWAPDIDVGGADYVIEVKVQKFSSDCTWVGIFGWMSASVAICDAKDSMRKVLFGKRIKGYGYGYGLTPVEAFTIPLNMSYWTVLSGIEKALRSPECEAVLKASSIVIVASPETKVDSIQSDNVTENLAKLKRLKDSDFITDEEPHVRRKKLVDQL